MALAAAPAAQAQVPVQSVAPPAAKTKATIPATVPPPQVSPLSVPHRRSTHDATLPDSARRLDRLPRTSRLEPDVTQQCFSQCGTSYAQCSSQGTDSGCTRDWVQCRSGCR